MIRHLIAFIAFAAVTATALVLWLAQPAESPDTPTTATTDAESTALPGLVTPPAGLTVDAVPVSDDPLAVFVEGYAHRVLVQLAAYARVETATTGRSVITVNVDEAVVTELARAFDRELAAYARSQGLQIDAETRARMVLELWQFGRQPLVLEVVNERPGQPLTEASFVNVDTTTALVNKAGRAQYGAVGGDYTLAAFRDKFGPLADLALFTPAR